MTHNKSFVGLIHRKKYIGLTIVGPILHIEISEHISILRKFKNYTENTQGFEITVHNELGRLWFDMTSTRHIFQWFNIRYSHEKT